MLTDARHHGAGVDKEPEDLIRIPEPQADVALDWPGTGRYQLSDAIAYSIRTPGKLLHEVLKVGGAQRPARIYYCKPRLSFPAVDNDQNCANNFGQNSILLSP